MRLKRTLEARSVPTAGHPGALSIMCHAAGEACRLLIDVAFACAAARFPGQRFVLVRAGGIELSSRPDTPAHRPDSRIVFRGRSSVTVAVFDGEPKPLMSGYFMLLAVDADGVPVPLQSTVAEENRS